MLKSFKPDIIFVVNVANGPFGIIPKIFRIPIVINVDGLFIETHFDPSNAKSDGANMLHIDYLEKLLTNLVEIRKTVNLIS